MDEIADDKSQPEPKYQPQAKAHGLPSVGLDAHASPTAPPARQTVFLDRLLGELKLRAMQADLKPRTIFVGGGTPTLLEPDAWRRWLNTMADMGLLRDVVEFTVEANPETVSPELMAVLVEGGVNRISMGAQSFQPESLKALERWHEPAKVGDAMRIARAAGITNINIDLIFAIPGQTMAMLEADIDAALALEPAHLSYYSLIYEPNTAMTQRLKMGRVTPVDEETERTMYERVIERLEDAGFEHYEVSNWARREPFSGGTDKACSEGLSVVSDNLLSSSKCSANSARQHQPGTPPRACQHNLIYWENENWIGLGPAAASHVNGHRWKNEAHLGRYLASKFEPPTVDHEHLPAERSIGEQLMLRLRLRKGVEHAWIDRFVPAGDARRREIDSLIGLRMLERTPTHIRLTYEGLFVADSVLARLV